MHVAVTADEKHVVAITRPGPESSLEGVGREPPAAAVRGWSNDPGARPVDVLSLSWETGMDASLQSFVASTDGRVIATGWDNGVVLTWSVRDGKELISQIYETAVLELALSRNGKYLASPDYEGVTREWPIDTQGDE